MNSSSDKITASSSPGSRSKARTPIRAVRATQKLGPVVRGVAAQFPDAQETLHGHDHDRPEHRLGQRGEQRGQEGPGQQHQRCRDQGDHRAAAARTLGGGAARRAAGDREAAEEAHHEVDRAHRDHLTVGLHLVAVEAGEAAGDAVGLGEGDQRHPERAAGELDPVG
ncbi:hypothetical protein O3S80_32130 [Streptomyces sp. Lzd4kr]|nr:hypothetical protein [Streptomyces sp. Lzd4kr]